MRVASSARMILNQRFQLISYVATTILVTGCSGGTDDASISESTSDLTKAAPCTPGKLCTAGESEIDPATVNEPVRFDEVAQVGFGGKSAEGLQTKGFDRWEYEHGAQASTLNEQFMQNEFKYFAFTTPDGLSGNISFYMLAASSVTPKFGVAVRLYKDEKIYTTIRTSVMNKVSGVPLYPGSQGTITYSSEGAETLIPNVAGIDVPSPTSMHVWFKDPTTGTNVDLTFDAIQMNYRMTYFELPKVTVGVSGMKGYMWWRPVLLHARVHGSVENKELGKRTISANTARGYHDQNGGWINPASPSHRHTWIHLLGDDQNGQPISTTLVSFGQEHEGVMMVKGPASSNVYALPDVSEKKVAISLTGKDTPTHENDLFGVYSTQSNTALDANAGKLDHSAVDTFDISTKEKNASLSIRGNARIQDGATMAVSFFLAPFTGGALMDEGVLDGEGEFNDNGLKRKFTAMGFMQNATSPGWPVPFEK